MIGPDADAARRVLAAFRTAAGFALDAPRDPFESTVSDPNFPGALLSLPRTPNADAVVYAVALSGSEWRRLRPLLLAFAGPTLTDFSGAPSPLSAASPAEQVLLDVGLPTLVRLRSPPATAVSAERALKRMVALVARAPPKAGAAPESTGRLLARIRDHLNALAIDEARRLLDRCRAEHRLDALNLKFLEVEILATARDWRAIAGLDGFDDLLQTRRPPAITAALLEALYWTAFGDAPNAARANYAGETRSRARDLIRRPAPPGLGDGAWRLYALEALAETPLNAALGAAALDSGAELGDLRTALEEALASVSAAAEAPVEPAAAITAADLTGSLSAFEQAQALLAALTDVERAALLEAAQPRGALAAMEDAYGAAPPSNWSEWIGRVADTAFTTALAVARQGAQEWLSDVADPVQADTLAEALLSAPDAPPAGERLLEALPHLVSWLMRDPEFPRPSSRSLYEAALDRVLLSGGTSTPLLDSAAALTRALLTLGLSVEAYRRVLMDVLEASGQGAGLRTAYWLIDLVEETLAAPAPDQAAREAFWQSALARLAPIARQLSPLQRLSLRRLAAGAGWAQTFDEPSEAAEPSPGDAALPVRLAGKLVAIYTLTASAGAQAADSLRTVAPEVDVRVNSEFDGSPRLQALAENADLFVVVAASATHAATDAIRAHRGDRPLVYTAGRGAVSILRAVEDWVQLQDA